MLVISVVRVVVMLFLVEVVRLVIVGIVVCCEFGCVGGYWC